MKGTDNPAILHSAQMAVWEIDMDHSSVGFIVRHLGIANIYGYFRKFTGNVLSDNDDLRDGTFRFTIDVSSLDSFNGPRDTHLKSADFFNVKDYPEMKFISSSFKRSKEDSYKLTGDLTIRDVTKKVTFDVVKGGEVTILGTKKVAFEATATINRFDFNMNWNTLTPEGIPIVDSNVTIRLTMEVFRGV